jgi:hypothetical protein
LPFGPVGVAETVCVGGQRPSVVCDGGHYGVGPAVRPTTADRLDASRRRADQHRRGVEEVHPVFEQDSAADGVVPEPVPGGQVLVGCVVLEGQPLYRAEQAGVAQSTERGQ